MTPSSRIRAPHRLLPRDTRVCCGTRSTETGRGTDRCPGRETGIAARRAGTERQPGREGPQPTFWWTPLLVSLLAARLPGARARTQSSRARRAAMEPRPLSHPPPLLVSAGLRWSPLVSPGLHWSLLVSPGLSLSLSARLSNPIHKRFLPRPSLWAADVLWPVSRERRREEGRGGERRRGEERRRREGRRREDRGREEERGEEARRGESDALAKQDITQDLSPGPDLPVVQYHRGGGLPVV